MSMVPMGGNKVSLNPKLVDRFPESYIAMGHTGGARLGALQRVARRSGRVRGALARARARGHLRAGRFKDDLHRQGPRVRGRQGEPRSISDRRVPRPGTTAEVLGKLKPAFKAGGSAIAGNSSPTNDGAGCTVVVSNQKLAELRCPRRSRATRLRRRGRGSRTSWASARCPRSGKLLKQTGLSLSDIDLFRDQRGVRRSGRLLRSRARGAGREAQRQRRRHRASAPARRDGREARCNPGVRAQRRGGRLGIVSMCIGGGMGAAGLFEV